jgi:hypothetical protein
MSDVTRLLGSVDAGELKATEQLLALVYEDPQAAEVIQMRYFVGMTVSEIEDALGLSPPRWTGIGPSPGRG